MNRSRKITYSAVGAAIAAILVVLTNFGWLKVSLLMGAALSYYIVMDKCGVWYGLATVLVSLIVAVSLGGVMSFSAFILDGLIFAPFAVLSYFIRKLYYTNWKTALLRLGIMIVFANLSLCAVWFTAEWITTVKIGYICSRLGGYPILALVFTAMALVFDFLFNQLSYRVVKLIK